MLFLSIFFVVQKVHHKFFLSRLEHSFSDHLAEMVVAEVNMTSSVTDSMASSLLGSSWHGSSMADSVTEKMSESSAGSASNEDMLNMMQALSSKVTLKTIYKTK